MKLYLFSGFLGSGKTTLVTTLAKKMVMDEKKKIMLIVNDVGDVGIDGSLMRQLETDVYEIFGGCICGQMGNLIPLLKGVGTKYDVEDILLEVSGIAQPEKFISDILAFAPKEMRLKIITLVDVTRWFILKQVIGDLLGNQVKTGELIILNKIDSATKEEVEAVMEDIMVDYPDKKFIKMATDNPESIMAHYEEVING